MTVTLNLSDAIEKKLHHRAQQHGLDMVSYIHRVLERDVDHPSNGAASKPQSFNEILAPIRAGFAASGLSEDELDRLMEEAREEVWREKQGLQQP